MAKPKRPDEVDALKQRTRRVLEDTQAAVEEANRAIRRTHDLIERIRQHSETDADLARLIDETDPDPSQPYKSA